MGLLSRLAAGPVGLVAGGYMTGELEEAKAEDILKKEDDDRKKNLVDYFRKAQINEGVKNQGWAQQRLNAIEYYKERGIPNSAIALMEDSGFFEGDNPMDAINLANQAFGHGWYDNPNNPNFQLMNEWYGQYENPPELGSKYNNQINKSQNIINKALGQNLGMGNQTVSMLTTPDISSKKTIAAPTETTTKPIDTTAAVKSFTPYQPPTARQVDDSQLRMALQNENTMIALGFKIDQEADFISVATSDGGTERRFNWAAFMARNPGSEAAVTLLNTIIRAPLNSLVSGTEEKDGFSDLAKHLGGGGQIDEAGLVYTTGTILADVIKAIGDEGEKHAVIRGLKTQALANGVDLGANIIPNNQLIAELDKKNPNWLEEYKNLDYDKKLKGVGFVLHSPNPFTGTSLESVFTEKEIDGKTYTMANNLWLPNNPVEDYEAARNEFLDTRLYNTARPLTYHDIRVMHSMAYGLDATRTIESGLPYRKEAVHLGVPRSTTGVTYQEIVRTDDIVPSIVAFKQKQFETTPITGMGETSSALLSGTELDSPAKIDEIKRDYETSPDELPAYIMTLLREQQDKGLLPKTLLGDDFEILANAIMDDIAEFEFEVKEDKADVGGDVDNMVETEETLVGTDEEILSPFDNEVAQLLEDTTETGVIPKLFTEEAGEEPWLLADGSFNPDFDPVAAGIDMTKKYIVGTDANKYEKAKRTYRANQQKGKVSDFFKKVKKGYQAFTEETE